MIDEQNDVAGHSLFDPDDLLGNNASGRRNGFVLKSQEENRNANGQDLTADSRIVPDTRPMSRRGYGITA